MNQNKKLKEYGFTLIFKVGTSEKERYRILHYLLKQKCVDNIQGRIKLQ